MQLRWMLRWKEPEWSSAPSARPGPYHHRCKKTLYAAGAAHGRHAGRDLLMGAVNELVPAVGMLRAHCQQFFSWYNGVHRHSGIGYMTPEAIHYGHADALFQQRALTLDAAFLANPKRFKGHAPRPPNLPIAAWINPPKRETDLKNIPEPSKLN